MIHWLRTIKQDRRDHLHGGEDGDRRHGRPQPTGEFETMEADTLILALGQDVDTEFLERVPGVEIAKDGVVQVDRQMMTGREGLFAGGDMVPAERTVTVGDRPRQEGGAQHRRLAARRNATTSRRSTSSRLRQAQHLVLRRRPANACRASFPWFAASPVSTKCSKGLNEDNALFEARRCLSCGNCFECDNCYGICPDNAVIKLGPGMRFQFNLDYCKGCGMCAAECPCGAIVMTPEEA